MYSEKTINRMIAFVGSSARECASCLRRNSGNCRECRSSWANSILVDIQSEQASSQVKQFDYSYGARIALIQKILKEAGRPLKSEEIDLGKDFLKICSKQLKLWTLRRLAEHGIIGHYYNPETKHHYYFHKPKGDEK